MKIIVSSVFSRRKRFRAFPQPASVAGKGLSRGVLEFFPVSRFTLLWRQNLCLHWWLSEKALSQFHTFLPHLFPYFWLFCFELPITQTFFRFFLMVRVIESRLQWDKYLLTFLRLILTCVWWLTVKKLPFLTVKFKAVWRVTVNLIPTLF